MVGVIETSSSVTEVLAHFAASEDYASAPDELFVRMNSVHSEARREADLDAIVRPGLEGVVAPKVDAADDVLFLARLLDEREAHSGLAPQSLHIIAAIESASGLLNAAAIAACSPRVVGLMLGAEDFALDIGLGTQREHEAAELLHARSSIVVAAAAAHRLSFDGVWPDITDRGARAQDAGDAPRAYG